MGRGAEDVLVQAGDAEPGVEPAGFDRAGAGGGGEVVEVGEELFGCKEAGVGCAFGVAAFASGYAASSNHAVEHCFNVTDYRVGARGGAGGEEPAAFVCVGEHGAFGWVEAAGLGRC